MPNLCILSGQNKAFLAILNSSQCVSSSPQASSLPLSSLLLYYTGSNQYYLYIPHVQRTSVFTTVGINTQRNATLSSSFSRLLFHWPSFPHSSAVGFSRDLNQEVLAGCQNRLSYRPFHLPNAKPAGEITKGNNTTQYSEKQ